MLRIEELEKERVFPGEDILLSILDRECFIFGKLLYRSEAKIREGNILCL